MLEKTVRAPYSTNPASRQTYEWTEMVDRWLFHQVLKTHHDYVKWEKKCKEFYKEMRTVFQNLPNREEDDKELDVDV